MFLFDEPLSNLDAKLRVQMRTEIVNLHRLSGATSIYVTHDQTEAMTMGSKLVVMNKGVIHQIGSPIEVYNNPVDLFTAGFLGSPQINIFEGEIFLNNGIRFKVANSSVEFQLTEDMFKANKQYLGKASIGIRPEFILPNENVFKNSIKTKIFNIEFLGHEQILYFDESGIKSSRITNTEIKYKINEIIKFGISPNGILIFDNNGNRI